MKPTRKSFLEATSAVTNNLPTRQLPNDHKYRSNRPTPKAVILLEAGGALNNDETLNTVSIVDIFSQLQQKVDLLSEQITQLLDSVKTQQKQDWYTIEQFARIVDKAEFTVREWCRDGRVNADKQRSGRGRHQSWTISHSEIERYHREGLLPLARRS